MNPRFLFLLACFLSAAALARAGTVEGEVTAIDARASTVTVAIKGKAQTWRVRPDTDITLNGAKTPLAGLTPKMTVKVTASDPSVATRLEAVEARVPIDVNDGLTGPERRAKFFGVKIMPSGPTNPDGTPADSQLAADLADSKWRMNDGKAFTLHANGTLEGNWPGGPGTWKPTAEHTAEWTFTAKARQADKVTFDTEAKNATWRDDLGRSNSAKRIPH